MANVFCINKSGGPITIYKFVDPSGGTKGTLYANELFTEHDVDGGHEVTFLNKYGSIDTGIILDKDSMSGVLTPWDKYPIDTFKEGGVTYYVFRLRSASEYCAPYNKDSTTNVPSGQYVATPYVESGDTRLTWMYITHVGNSKRPGRVKTTDYKGTHDYAYINSGLENSSSTSGIALYGSW